MPNIKSAKKRMRQAAVRQSRNRAAKSELRTLSRKATEVAGQGKATEAAAALTLAARRLDQAAAKKIIHKNAAARRKSRLAAAMKRAKVAAK
jgi:small subunit ribosomal protein S20